MLAPGDGRVLTVPVTRGAVVLAGEPVATIGGGGFFLRLAIPERHADSAEGGRVDPHHRQRRRIRRAARQDLSADRERPRHRRRRGRPTCETAFVDARVLVEVPVGERDGAAGAARRGRDPLRHRLRHACAKASADVARAVVLGEGAADGDLVEVLTGLAPGDVVVTP